jgi:hypothetical protein
MNENYKELLKMMYDQENQYNKYNNCNELPMIIDVANSEFEQKLKDDYKKYIETPNISAELKSGEEIYIDNIKFNKESAGLDIQEMKIDLEMPKGMYKNPHSKGYYHLININGFPRFNCGCTYLNLDDEIANKKIKETYRYKRDKKLKNIKCDLKILKKRLKIWNLIRIIFGFKELK